MRRGTTPIITFNTDLDFTDTLLNQLKSESKVKEELIEK